MKTHSKYLSCLFCLVFLFTACEKKTKEIDGTMAQPVETINMGKINVWCDEAIWNVLDSAIKMYDNFYEKVEVETELGNARKVMAQLLSANTRVIVIARDYLPDEDSLMKEYGVEPHYKMEVAKDALVFFANPEFPLDTISDELLKKVLGENEKLSSYFPQLNKEPEFVILDQNSSVYANLMYKVLNSKEPKKRLKMFSTIDSVKQYVRENNNTIGIAYLGHVVNDDDLTPLRVGFTHKNGKREYPQIVHQSYIVMERYPYIISYWVYLLEERRNLPFWFASFISKEAIVQTWFKDAGIVPAYATFQLIQSE